MDSKQNIMFVSFVFLMLLTSMVGYAVDNIPGNIKYTDSSSSDSSSVKSTSLLSSLFSILLTGGKTTWKDNEQITLTQTETTWKVYCSNVKQVTDVYQNSNLIKALGGPVGSVSGINQQFNSQVNLGTLSAGTYGIVGFLWCADLYSSFGPANNCPSSPVSGSVCYDYKNVISQRISNVDQQDITVVGSCIPSTEICDQKDNDCDSAVDELNVCSTQCLPDYSQKCYNNDVWFYDSCNVRQRLSSVCLSSETCSISSGTAQCIAPVTCTSFTYSAWGTCTSGSQSRTVTTSSPTGCTGGTPILSQSCTVPINGVCGSTNNICTAGISSDQTDSATNYLWQCLGSNGGTTTSCSVAKPVSIPATPTGLTVVRSPTFAQLTWNSVSDATSYKVYLSQSPTSGFVLVTTLAITSPSLGVSSLVPATTYYFKVSAVNSAGESPLSGIVSGPAPQTYNNNILEGSEQCDGTNLNGQTCITKGFTSGTLSCTSPGTFVTSACITTVSVNGLCGATNVACTTGTFNEQTDTLTNYLWQCNGANAGTTSSCNVAKLVPPIPIGLIATVISPTEINLAWTISPGATAYNIFRATSSSGPFTKIDSSLSNTYRDTGLTAGTAYYYKVTAVNHG